MNNPAASAKTLAQPRAQAVSLAGRLRPFLALSRTPHCLLDLAAPFVAALLCLGYFPDPSFTLFALFTAFAGYTAVYAVNDIVDYRTDRANQTAFAESDGYLDGALMRHPLAHGALTMGQALAWAGGWGLVALAGSWVLNPICTLLLLTGVLLEIVYCLLLKVSHWRALVNGVVKTLGALAAVWAVNPHPSAPFVALLFVTLFCWEIGGQNIPADWFDLELDERQGAKTLPLVLGTSRAASLVLACLSATTLLGALLFFISPAHVPWPWALAALVPGAALLLWPAARLLARQDKARAGALFNRASYYPLALLGVFLLGGLRF